MVEIKLTIDGKKQTFKKKEFTIRDNMLAIKHQIVATEFYADEKNTNDPEEYEQLQVNFAKTISQIFNNEFTYEQLLNGLAVKEMSVLDQIYIEALGGEIEDKDEKKSLIQ